MKNLFAVPAQLISGDLALLILRVVVGAAFMLHGWGKIQHPLSWMGSEVPGFFQLLAATSEFFGGLAWILGLLTALASFGIGCTMLVAIYVHFVQGLPFVDPAGGHSFEPASIYLCIAVVLLLVGPGRISIDRRLFGERRT